MKSKSSRSYFTGSRCRILFLACLISNIVLLQFFILEHFSRKEEDKTLFEFSSGGKYGDNGENYEPKGDYGKFLKKAISRQSAEQSRQRKELNAATNGDKSSRRHPAGITPNTCQPQNDRLHPLCEEKFEDPNFQTYETGYEFIEELKKKWKEKCYKDYHGIDGTNCSILSYLQKIDTFCPYENPTKRETERVGRRKSVATLKTDLRGFLSLLSHKDFDWMRKRATAFWPEWTDAARNLNSEVFATRDRKKILFFPGALSYSRWLLQNAGKGSFLGEVVQWTDTIASAYILGHDVTVILEHTNLSKVLQKDVNGCAAKISSEYPQYDIIFTDILGQRLMDWKYLGKSTSRNRCKLRLLDSFGTEAEFNYDKYHEPIPLGKGGWGGGNFLLPQFLTYFPHSPDNTFLGIAAGSGKFKLKSPKKNQALIYGKSAAYLKNQTEYLNTIFEYFEIHATFAGGSIPSYVKNHGILDAKKLNELLAESKVFIGLGFPFEGPGPLEAISYGAVFLNPKYDIPKSKFNDKFFDGKPNLRKITSQNQYLEDFVGEPFVHTFDVNDKEKLRDILRKIKESKTSTPYLPREFTYIGMLERVHGIIQHQNLCDVNAPRWPPIDGLYKFIAEPGRSCKDECHRRGLICEPTFFNDINSAKSFKQSGIKCKSAVKKRTLHAPSYHEADGACYIQDHQLYFSCVKEDKSVRRLCPCRTFIKGQTALCEGCL